MRSGPILDPEGDRVLEAEQRDRELEKVSHPSIFLGPLNRCETCGCVPVELSSGQWVCACNLPIR